MQCPPGQRRSATSAAPLISDALHHPAAAQVSA
eukprot:CAMPEP_0118929006 /NCGR_PEP_ID=MMETSP1169-20130426/6135_1 /TAXON_ID=36882 /ORGANISM="Pyramimonas obovata, Strain CCMP722" /LENGTH=32 /DNA_ID= /DNA_START= /DNA_END= /DNA_ORIENTATION=